MPTAPEIKSDELLQIVNGLKIKWLEVFEFDGVRFTLYPSEEEYSDEEGAFLSSAVTTGLSDYDLYVSTLEPELIRRRIFHEVLEACLRSKDFDNQTAHEMALEEEEKMFGNR